jgi:hypothetical protein
MTTTPPSKKTSDREYQPRESRTHDGTRDGLQKTADFSARKRVGMYIQVGQAPSHSLEQRGLGTRSSATMG